MKNPLIRLNLTKEKAQKELNLFGKLSLIASVVSLFIFWWLSIPGMAFGLRGILLAQLNQNKDNPKLKQSRTFSIVGLVVGLIALIFYQAAK